MRFLSVDLMTEPGMSKWGGSVGLSSGSSCESPSPDVSLRPSCVIAGHFHAQGKLARARRSIVALNAYARDGGNSKREESADKGTLAGLASSDTVIFPVGSRASVMLNNVVVLCSANLSERVRAQHGIFMPNVYAMGGANAKRE